MAARRIIVKFVEGTNVRLRHGRLMRFTEDNEPAEEIKLPGYENVVIGRYFAEDELSIEKERQQLLTAGSPEQPPDLNLFYAVTPRDERQLTALCEFLKTLPLVEEAYLEEEPALPEADALGREGMAPR